MDLTADLRFGVDAPGGARATGTVTADGETVRVRTDAPAVLIRSLRSDDRTRTAALGDLLSATGVTVEVSGPRGAVARLGAGVDSRLGRLLTGSPNVGVRGVPATMWRFAGSRIGAAAVAVPVATVVAVATIVVGQRRSRRG